MQIENILKEAKWIGKEAAEDWMEKVVEHTTPGGQKRKVKVKSLPPEEQAKYRPQKEDKKEELKEKIEEKKKDIKQPSKEESKINKSIPFSDGKPYSGHTDDARKMINEKIGGGASFGRPDRDPMTGKTVLPILNKHNKEIGTYTYGDNGGDLKMDLSKKDDGKEESEKVLNDVSKFMSDKKFDVKKNDDGTMTLKYPGKDRNYSLRTEKGGFVVSNPVGNDIISGHRPNFLHKLIERYENDPEERKRKGD